jgi:hypothetical protein
VTIQYYPGVIVTFLGPSNVRGARVKLQLPDRNLPTKTISYRYELDGAIETAAQALTDAGFTVVGQTDHLKKAGVLLVQWGGGNLPELWAKIGK